MALTSNISLSSQAALVIRPSMACVIASIPVAAVSDFGNEYISSASIIATSLGGLIAYMVLGWNVPNLPAYSIGYVNLIQFVFLTITSTIVAGYAANISKKVDSKKLKIVHILLVLYLGLKMVGIV